MTVRYITMSFPARAETFACTDIRMLLRRGIEAAVYSMRPEPADAKALLAERHLARLPVHHSSIRDAQPAVLEAARSPGLTLRWLAWLLRKTWRQPRFLLISLMLVPRSLSIAASLRADRPDVVHLFWGHYPSLVGYLVRRQLPQTTLSVFLGAYDLASGYGPSADVASHADVVWTHAWANVPAIEALGVAPERIAVVHRGIDLDLFRPGGPTIPHRIVCASRLCHDKHVDDVVMAFATVTRTWPDATLDVMGDGPDRARLERLCRTLKVGERVRFLGHVPHEVVVAELSTAEILMLMSQEAGDRLANVTKEAMACGCVCVVSRTPGIEELVLNGVHGFVVEPGDVDAAASRIDWAFRHPTAVADMRAASRSQIRESFDATKAMREYDERWRALVSSRQRGLENVSHAAIASPTPMSFTGGPE